MTLNALTAFSSVTGRNGNLTPEGRALAAYYAEAIAAGDFTTRKVEAQGKLEALEEVLRASGHEVGDSDNMICATAGDGAVVMASVVRELDNDVYVVRVVRCSADLHVSE